MNPITREEQYYDAILQNAQGGDAETPEPITREEQYLKEIAENVGGGSGVPAGGTTGQLLGKKSDADGDVEWKNPPEGTLPATTSADAGKFARVDEDGNWDKDGGDDLARINGYYEGMGVATADQLVSSQGVTDTAPYLFRPTGGMNDVGNRKNVKLVGGTVAWNQLANVSATDYSFDADGITFTDNRDGTYTIDGTATAGKNCRLFEITTVLNHGYLITTDSRIAIALRNDIHKGNKIISMTTGAGTTMISVYIANGETYDNVTFRVNIFDLTLDFGSAIADRAYTLEQAEAGEGIKWLKSYGFFAKDYYANDAGSLKSAKPQEMIDRGFNLLDPATGKAKLLGGKETQITGNYTALSYTDINGDSETITPDASGIFTPTNDGVLTVTGTGNICVHLVNSGTRNGEYDPYRAVTTALIGREFTRRYGIVDLGTLNYTYSATYGYFKVTNPPSDMGFQNYNYNTVGNIKSAKYITAPWARITTTDDMIIALQESYFALKDSTKTGSDLNNGHASWLEGVYLVYELAEPTTAVYDANTELRGIYKLDANNNIYCDGDEMDLGVLWCDDWGTEEIVDDRDVPIPCGHDSLYIANMVDKLNHLPSLPALGDGDYIVRVNGTQMTLIPFPATFPSDPSEDGTYNLTFTKSGDTKTLSWEAIE